LDLLHFVLQVQASDLVLFNYIIIKTILHCEHIILAYLVSFWHDNLITQLAITLLPFYMITCNQYCPGRYTTIIALM
jgi:hypothetical protein